VGCSKLGMLPRAALPLRHPGRVGGPGWCDAGRSLASCCASFAPLFINVLKSICQSGFTTWCQAVRAAPGSGCSARHGGAHLAKHPTPNASESPPAPGLQDFLHIPTAVSAQPGPSSFSAGTQQPAHLLPTSCHHHRASEPRKAEKPLEKAGPKCHLASSTPVGACPPAHYAGWDCPRCRDLPPDLLLSTSHPDTKGMDMRIPGTGGPLASKELHFAATTWPPHLAGAYSQHSAWHKVFPCFSLLLSPSLSSPFSLAPVPHAHARGRTFRHRLPCARATRGCGAGPSARAHGGAKLPTRGTGTSHPARHPEPPTTPPSRPEGNAAARPRFTRQLRKKATGTKTQAHACSLLRPLYSRTLGETRSIPLPCSPLGARCPSGSPRRARAVLFARTYTATRTLTQAQELTPGPAEPSAPQQESRGWQGCGSPTGTGAGTRAGVGDTPGLPESRQDSLGMPGWASRGTSRILVNPCKEIP